MTDLTCERCGTPYSPGMNFCSICGAQLGPARDTRSLFMTVLFVDLVGSTDATQRIGNEEMFRLIEQFQRICQGAIREAGGFVAKFMGDGAMAYFGYPSPMKHSAVMALNAAMEIIRTASERLSIDGAPVQSSCGIATGWSVVNTVRAGETAQEALAIGDTVNRAARLQALADADSVFLSSEVHRALDPRSVTLREVGASRLKGFQNPIDIWAVDVQHRAAPQAASAGGEDTAAAFAFGESAGRWTPGAPQDLRLVGRAEHLAQMAACYNTAADGKLTFADILAPGGYGKTRLAEEFLSTLATPRVLRLSGARHKSEQSFAAFRAPVLSLMKAAAGDGDVLQAIGAWAPNGAADGLERLLNLSQIPVASVVRQARIAAALSAVLQRELDGGPMILFVDDAQWLDQDSIDFLAQAAKDLAHTPLFVLATHRLEDRRLDLLPTLRIDLTPLTDQAAEHLISGLDPDGRIAPTVRARIVERASGIPLYVNHYTMTVLEQPDTSLDTFIPETLIEALQQRLDMGGDERGLVEAVAVLEDHATIAIASALMNRTPGEVERLMTSLEARGVLRARGAEGLQFDHALLRDAVHESLLKTRLRTLHQAALAACRSVAPGLLAANPVIEANHLIGGGAYAEAIPKLADAARLATLRGEISESVRVLEFAKGLLDKVVDPASRDRLEMTTQFAVGNALVQQQGFGAPSVAEAYNRALTLCEAMEGGGEIEFQIAWGIWAHLTVVSDIDGAVRMIDRMTSISQVVPELEVLSQSAGSVMNFNLGRFDQQTKAYRRTRQLYDLDQHRLHALTYSMDSLGLATLFEAHGRFMAGDVDGWEAAIADARAHDAALGIPLLSPYFRIFSTAARCYAPSPVPIRDELAAARALAEELGQPFWVMGGDLWMAAERYQNASPLDALHDLEAATLGANALGIDLLTRFHEALLAHSYACAGSHDASQALWTKIRTPENRTGNTMIWPEVLRLAAESKALAGADDAAVRSDLQEAEALARGLGAGAWLAKILQSRQRLGFLSGDAFEAEMEAAGLSWAGRHHAFAD